MAGRGRLLAEAVLDPVGQNVFGCVCIVDEAREASWASSPTAIWRAILTVICRSWKVDDLMTNSTQRRRIADMLAGVSDGG